MLDQNQNMEDTKNDTSKEASSRNSPTIFDERFRLFTDTFGRTCEQEEVNTAIAIIIDPKIIDQPIVFMRGNEYDAAKLLAMILRQLRRKIVDDITP